MFRHRQHHFSRLSKSYPFIKILDVYDKDSFIRGYILDNVFVCIFMYILFYFAIWYAHKVIKRIEQKNREMLVTVEKNRLRLDHMLTLKNKRSEYEEVVLKAKGDQKLATKQLDNQIKRLSIELISTMNKLNELESFFTKMIFSGNFGKTTIIEQRKFLTSKTTLKTSRQWRTQSRMSRYSNRRFHRQYPLSHPRASSASLHDHQPHIMYLRKSDSSNRASAESSSTDSSYQGIPRR